MLNILPHLLFNHITILKIQFLYTFGRRKLIIDNYSFRTFRILSILLALALDDPLTFTFELEMLGTLNLTKVF